MRLSTKGRYAVMAMMDLSIHEETGPVTLADISASQAISLSYLEQIFARLRKEGLVEGTRGPGGGYRLAKPAEEISVADVVTAVDEQVRFTDWKPNAELQLAGPYLTHDLWRDLSGRIHDFLDSITLAELVGRPGVKEAAMRQDEYQRWGWRQRKSAA
jgi:Rrf2 family iron-sulfur cluster assembly transcriptional regulator